MPQLANLKHRIRAVATTRQITKAMQLVATTRLKRAEEAASAPRAFVQATTAMVARLSALPGAAEHPYFQALATGSTLLIVIAGDRGLAGPYNSNIVRAVSKQMQATNEAPLVIGVGRRASSYLARFSNLSEVAAYDIGESSPVHELVAPIMNQIDQLYRSTEVDRVQLIYTEFESPVHQTVKVVQLLPQPLASQPVAEAELEASLISTLDTAIRQHLQAQITQAIVSARASEQAARMIAMMNATDNATDLTYDLTLAYNTARQAAITTEIAEISTGAAASAR